MTLGRQLALAVSAVFLFALLGVQAIHLLNSQSHLQQQLESLAQDSATSIGLSLGTLLKGGDIVLAESVINAAFDRGNYEQIRLVSPAGAPLVEKNLPPTRAVYPAWFAAAFPLEAPSAQSLVSAGWKQVGRLYVTVSPRFAYRQLWATARDTAIYLLLIYAAALLALQLFLRGVLRPLAAVEGAAQAISARNFVTLRIRPRTRELARVVAAMNSLSAKVNEAIEAGARRAETLQAAIYQDPLTGLLNGRGFAARFDSTYDGEGPGFAGVLALVEITDLHAINRQIGAERCDEMLRIVYGRMDEAARAMGGFTGRWTGSLTILAMPQLRSDRAREELAALRTRAGVTIREYGIAGAERIFCGAVEGRGEAVALTSMERAAEEALLQARETPDGIVIAPAPAAPARQAPALSVEAVCEAMSARRLALVGQVAYRMSDHRALHTEVLARLQDADGQEMAAGQFMPIVAAHGLVGQLDRLVIERAVETARDREDEVSINVSMHSIEEAEFTDWLVKLLVRERRAAARLVFEVAEHGIVKNGAAAKRFSEMLARAGAGFGIDNFGVHRDSLVLLQRLKPTYIKLAGVHTPRMLHDGGARFFAESVVRAARQLDIPVIAQMVEDDETFQALGTLGFAGYQGNLIGKPSPWPMAPT